MRGDERERMGQHMRCALPHSYSGDPEGVNPPLPRLPAHPPASLFACPLLYSLHASSYASLLTSTLALAVVDSARVPTWHGRLFVEGMWRCRRWAALALSIGRCLGADVAQVGNGLGGGCRGCSRCPFDGICMVTSHASGWGQSGGGGGVVCVRLVVVEWVGGADVAPERAVGGGQAVGIVVGRLGLTYPGVMTVTWHQEGGMSAWKWC